ncbi:MAG: hypothetical protein ABSE49_09900 [Polyangiaceae bacterium]|jgi:hypothetical protein
MDEALVMTQRYGAKLPIFAGLLGSLCASPALAGEQPCSPIPVEADANVRRRWPGLPERVREAFEAREDIDACARVTLLMTNGSITVEVVLPDGRSASRFVSKLEDVVPTLEALLLVPSHRTPAETTAFERPSSPPPPASPSIAPSPDTSSRRAENLAFAALPTSTRDRRAEAPAGSPPSRLRIELSVVTGARLGDGQVSVGAGALAFLDLGGWLVGFAGRADRYETLGGVYASTAVELALLGGRRIWLKTFALDLTAGPAVLPQGTTSVQSYQNQTTSESSGSSSSSLTPRLLVSARLNISARSTLRTFVGVDGELGPARASDDDPTTGARQLPVWTLGLALGASVGTQ